MLRQHTSFKQLSRYHTTSNQIWFLSSFSPKCALEKVNTYSSTYYYERKKTKHAMITYGDILVDDKKLVKQI